MKKALFFPFALIAVSSLGAETGYQWQRDASTLSYDGRFDDPAHWSGGFVPDADCRAEVGNLLSWKDIAVTMPAGEYANHARFVLSTYPGHVATLDCSQTSFRHPEYREGTYSTSPFNLCYSGIAVSIFGLSTDSAVSTDPTLGPTTAPQFEVSNTVIRLSSPAEKDIRLELNGGGYNFHNVLGHTWSTSTVYPRLYVFGQNDNNASTGLPQMNYSEVIVTNGASVSAPTLCVQGNSWTNVFRLHGGTHSCTYCYIPARFNGQQFSESATLTDFVLEDGSVFTFTKDLYLGQYERATNRITRLMSRTGSELRFAAIDGIYGHHSFIADGGRIVFGRGNQNLRPNGRMTCSLVAVNGGRISMDQEVSGSGMYLGYVSPTGERFSDLATIDVSNATFEVCASAKLNHYSGSARFRDALVDVRSICSVGGSADPVRVSIANSVVSNVVGSLSLGGNGAVNLAMTNSFYFGDFLLGGAETGTGAVFQTNLVDSVGNVIDLGGKTLHVGSAANTVGIFNHRTGTVCSSGEGVHLQVGASGQGELNVFDGDISVYQGAIAGVGRAATDALAESALRMYGGTLEMKATAAGVGLSVADGSAKNRRARLVLNGGVLSAGTVYGGQGATVCGGTGWAAFEADGGTLRASCSSAELLHHFDEAKLGPDGLTIDSNGHDVTVDQSLSNKAGEEGLLVLDGAGVKSMLGDLSGVSRVVLRGGCAAFATGELANLTVEDGTVLTLDPTKTLVVSGEATFGDFVLAFSSATEIGRSYDLIRLTKPLTDASLSAWQRAIVASGLPVGAGCDLVMESDGAGGYLLRGRVRPSSRLVIELKEGTSNGTDAVSYSCYDTLVVAVSNGASLALSGQLSSGGMEKTGSGALALGNVDNLFIPGFLLLDGKISTASEAALGVGRSANVGGGRIKHGALEITGADGEVVFGTPLSLVSESTNDIIVIKNDVDVRMPAFDCGTVTGELLKRGAGRLEVEVSGTANLPGGSGYGGTAGGYWGNQISTVSQLRYDPVSGLPVTNGVSALVVAEGELKFTGVGEGAVVKTTGSAAIGLSSDQGSAQPGFVLDNVKYDATGLSVLIGTGIDYSTAPYQRTGDFALHSYVVLSNNAALTASTINLNRLSDSTAVLTTLDVESSTFEATYAFSPNRAQSAGAKSRSVFRNGSNLFCRNFYLFRDTTLTFDNSVLARNAALDPIVIEAEVATLASSTACLNFFNGSRLYCASITPPTVSMASYHPITLTFDDSDWYPTRTDDFTFEWAEPEKVIVAVTNVGLRLDVPAAKIWTFNHPITGPGGVVKRGDGTLRFGEGAIAYSGVTRCESGIVDLGGNAQAVRLAGAGRFVNGTVAAGGGIVIEVDDEYRTLAAPVLSGISSSGSFRVDLGRTAENPLVEPFRPITVCTYEGAAPNVSGWRLRGTGVSNVRGVFTAANGVVTVTPEHTGILMIVR